MKQKREKLTIDNNEKKEVEKIGEFKMFKLGKGFGFIKTYQGDAFCHITDMCSHFIEEDEQGNRRFKFEMKAHQFPIERGKRIGGKRCIM